MIKHALANWKTTSVGVTMIVGATVHLIFQVKAGNSNENTWTIWAFAIVAGIGSIFAGDAGTSVQKSEIKTDSNTGFLRQTDAAATLPADKPQP